MSEGQIPSTELHPMHFGLLLFGGLCFGTGVINLYYAFGWPGGDMNTDFSQIGFSGIDNIELLPPGDLALPLIAIGGLCLVIANATAWKETDGY